MKIGLCASMVVDDLRLGGIEVVERIAAFGYDYVELSISHLTMLSEVEFQSVLNRLAQSGIPCESCNNLFPPTMQLLGEQRDMDAILIYAEKAIGRAASLGAKIIVFGSGQAKQVPAGFSMDFARIQLAEICLRLGNVAEKHGITIVLEPLRKAECNIINTVAEALALCQSVNHPAVKVLCDYYHLTEETESAAVLLKAGDDLRHVHFANPVKRSFPTGWNDHSGFTEFFDNLKKTGYNGRISVEAYTDNFERDAPAALQFLRSATTAINY